MKKVVSFLATVGAVLTASRLPAAAVAQNCTLLYRRFVIGRPSEFSGATKSASGLPSATLRYSRVQLCATSHAGTRVIALCRTFAFVLLLGAFVMPGFADSKAVPPYTPRKGERIALVGNSLAERMSLYGHFETLLHSRFPKHALVVRNFARPADEVAIRQRPNDYTKLDDPLAVFAPDTFICFFGFNESFAAPGGTKKFKSDYEAFIAEYTSKYGSETRRPRLVLISPIAFENTGDRLLPFGVRENESLQVYTAAIAEVAKKLSLPFVDLFAPTQPLFDREAGAQFTINGCHLNEAGDRAVAEVLDRALFGSANPAVIGSSQFEKLRAAVNDKSWIHQQDYRMLNGWYVYGGRRAPHDTETFPEEYQKIRQMVAVRDRYVWDLAQNKTVPSQPDDRGTLQLTVPKTAFGTRPHSEPKELRYLGGEEAIAQMQTAPGFEVTLFASEEQFPEVAKPVQINFDNQGRLWVASMPTYPQWKPGDPRPNDRLVILEDTNNDGRADKAKVFYDQLHCPTGFEFWNGGVLVTSQPRLLFLKDTNGDDRADLVVELADGWASDDTHHTIGAFEWSPGGLLHMLEGVAMSTTVETPWGPFRNRNTPGSYVFNPRLQTIRHFVTPGYGNGWCYTFDNWGQGIVGDGTSAQHHWDSPLSGAQFSGRRSLRTVFNNEGMRPALGSEFLYSRHFPDDVQGQFIYACVINMNGIPRFQVTDEGAGFGGKRVADLLKSNDRNFRPADPQIGPDGALWFGDWHNPLIGHMQYSQRDPNRDKTRGRIYRLTATGRPLLAPVTQFGKPVNELLDQLKEYEPRTRYRARRELRDRPTEEVLEAIKQWVGKLSAKDLNYERHLLEALWVQQGHHEVDRSLLGRVLKAKNFQARAAAVRVVSDEQDFLPNPFALLTQALKDEHPRVRLEAVRALSFFPNMEAVELVLTAVNRPMDEYLEYTVEAALGGLETVWKQPLQKQQLIAANNPAGAKFLADYVEMTKPGGAALKPLRTLLGDATPEQHRRAIQDLAKMKGSAGNGKAVFGRMCVVCHKVGNEGIEFGPALDGVGKRLKRNELIESIIDPNAKIDPKWATTNLETRDGDAFSGFITAETKDTLTLRIAGGITQEFKKADLQMRETVKSSSMPEGLAAGISPQEFLDLIEYLAGLK